MLLRNKYKNLSLLVLTYSHGNFLLYSFDYELIKCLYDKNNYTRIKKLECVNLVAIYHIWKIYFEIILQRAFFFKVHVCFHNVLFCEIAATFKLDADFYCI